MIKTLVLGFSSVLLVLLPSCQSPVYRDMMEPSGRAEYLRDPAPRQGGPSVLPFEMRTTESFEVGAHWSLVYCGTAPVYAVRIVVRALEEVTPVALLAFIVDGDGVTYESLTPDSVLTAVTGDSTDPDAGRASADEAAFAHWASLSPLPAEFPADPNEHRGGTLFFQAPRPFPLSLHIRIEDTNLEFESISQFH
jgi:hypothetical protein